MNIDYETIHVLAEEARKEEADIDRLIRYRGIELYYASMGKHPRSCKGFCVITSRIPVIGINADFPRRLQRLVKAHEVGHIMVPSDAKGLRQYHDFDVYGNYENDRDELNANIWSAEYQLSDDEVMKVLQGEYGFFEAARCLRVAPELLDFKFRSMKARGFHLNSPIYAHKNYMDKSL
ncbi:MAG: ImmA/IrrE family metallo-endopeptidase [Clostridia bacterium]|nr:ImmA/IrrE family metallo-endopeptidase [Clostridia bacterium]